jgi:hypothetical protein
MSDHRVRRRTVCRRAAAAILPAGLAGCIGGDSGDQPEERDVPDELSFDTVKLSPAFPFKLVLPAEVTEERLCVTEVQYHRDDSGFSTHWHFQPLTVPYQIEYPIGLAVFDPEMDPIPLGANGQLQVGTRFETDADSRPFTVSVEGDEATFLGQRHETAKLIFDIKRGSETLWSTPSLSVQVVDETELRNKCSPGELPDF